MDPRSGRGRISYYAFNENHDAAGGTDKIVVGGFGNTAMVDQNGPVISGFLDTATFRNGDLVSPSPVLYLELSDISGINQTGSLGHEIIAVIDGDQSKAVILNDLFVPTSSNRSERYNIVYQHYLMGSIRSRSGLGMFLTIQVSLH